MFAISDGVPNIAPTKPDAAAIIVSIGVVIGFSDLFADCFSSSYRAIREAPYVTRNMLDHFSKFSMQLYLHDLINPAESFWVDISLSEWKYHMAPWAGYSHRDTGLGHLHYE